MDFGNEPNDLQKLLAFSSPGTFGPGSMVLMHMDSRLKIGNTAGVVSEWFYEESKFLKTRILVSLLNSREYDRVAIKGQPSHITRDCHTRRIFREHRFLVYNFLPFSQPCQGCQAC